jgi:hypothetical protein
VFTSNRNRLGTNQSATYAAFPEPDTTTSPNTSCVHSGIRPVGDATACGQTIPLKFASVPRPEGIAPGLPVWSEDDPALDELPHHLPRDRRMLTVVCVGLPAWTIVSPPGGEDGIRRRHDGLRDPAALVEHEHAMVAVDAGERVRLLLRVGLSSARSVRPRTKSPDTAG